MNMSILEHALKNGSYFYILNRGASNEVPMALTYLSEQPDSKLHFQELDQTSHDQVWMIEQVQSNRYQLVHAYSTLVLTASKTQSWMGKGRWDRNQLFFVQKSDPKNNPFEHWIRQSKQSDLYLQYETRLKCSQSNPKASKCRWEFKKITSKNQIFNSCLIQFAYSGLYLDLPGASLRPGASVIQYKLNSRCNQRWKLSKSKQSDDCFMILSVRSKMCLTVKGDKAQGGTPVIQDTPSKALGQQWLLAHQGLSLYIIESKLKKGLFLGVYHNSMDEQASLVLATRQEYAFWRILGTFNQKE